MTRALISILFVHCLFAIESRAEPVAFVHARILPATGPAIDDGALVIDQGKILAVGKTAEVTIPEGAQRRDATGLTIIPGLVDTHSHIGIYPRPAVPAHSDGNEMSGPVQPGLRAIDAIWPDDPGIRMARAGGITTANIMPGSGNAIGGQTLYVKLRGNTIEEMRIVPATVLGGLKMANGENPKNYGRRSQAPFTRMKVAALQREQFVKAKDYQQKWAAYRKAQEDGKTMPAPEKDPAMDSLVEVLEHKRTVHFHSHRADDLMTAMRIAEEFGFELVLQHATEGYRVAEEIAKRKIPCSLTLVDSPGGKAEVMNLVEENAALLNKAGVLVAINTDDFITESRFFLRTGAIAVRGGMPELEALKALTINPAKMLHLDDRLGSLEKGKDADFVILSGNPFSVYTHVLETWIDGKRVFQRENPRDFSYQAGGYALDSSRAPKMPAAIKPLATLPAPELKQQSVQVGAQKAKALAIRAGRIHTASNGIIEKGVIVIEDGKIVAVGEADKIDLPADVRILAAAEVTPGLIDAHTVVGLSGALNTPADQDQDESSDPNQADLRVLDSFNTEEALLEFLRQNGITTVHAMPGRVNVFAGQTGVFHTYGLTAEKAKLRFPAGILVNLGEVPKASYPNKTPLTRMAVAGLVRTTFTQAKEHARKRADDPAKTPHNLKLEALEPALARKLPVVFSAQRADDLMTALRLAKEFDLNPILDLCTEGYLISDEISKAKAPVIVHPAMQRIASSMETVNSFTGNAGFLADHGIPIALGTGYEGYVPKTRVLRFEMGIAAVNGLGRDRAIKAATLDAAKLLQIDDRTGSIEKGKMADLVLYDGDPLENATHVIFTIIEGKIVYDREDYLKIPFARRALPLATGGGAGCCMGDW
ncbi:MAG TPA: amidohydrolase family protein [Gemmataceae bacterium]|nr:amidohydrolase family protein [Gemmataceae bacterium]